MLNKAKSSLYDESEFRVELERVTLLYKNGYMSIGGVFISLCTLLLVIYDLMPAVYVIAWTLLILVFIPPRVWLLESFNKALQPGRLSADNIIVWERRWAITAMFPALGFTLIAYYPFAENSFIAVMFVALTIQGMCAGSIIASNTSPLTVNLFFNVATLPLILRCFIENEQYYTYLGVYLVCFYFVFQKLSSRLNETLGDSIRLQINDNVRSLKDSLTGLWNRRQLYLYIDQLIKQTRRSRQVFCIMLLDIDNFKVVNDTYGHKAGDDMLVNISNTLSECCREGDLLVRYGGEEFIMILPDTKLFAAEIVINRVLSTVRKNCGATISAGVVEFNFDITFEEALAEADVALYEAKTSGKDCFVIGARSKQQVVKA